MLYLLYIPTSQNYQPFWSMIHFKSYSVKRRLYSILIDYT